MSAGAEEIGEAHGLAWRRRRAYPMCSCFAPLEEVLGGGINQRHMGNQICLAGAVQVTGRSSRRSRRQRMSEFAGDPGWQPVQPWKWRSGLTGRSRCADLHGWPRATWAAHTRSFTGNR
jgi:hypothetical protein